MEQEQFTWVAIAIIAITALTNGFIGYFFNRAIQKAQSKFSRDLNDSQNAFNRRLNEIQFQSDYRQKAAIVADLFARWIQSGSVTAAQNNQPGFKSKKGLTPDDWRELNRLTFECSFWLSDELIIEIKDRLVNAPGAKNVKEILIDVRNYLNPNIEPINYNNIIHF